MKKIYLIIFLPLLLILGCTDEDKTEHLLDGHQKSMEKAKDLDKVIQEGIEKRQKGHTN